MPHAPGRKRSNEQPPTSWATRKRKFVSASGYGPIAADGGRRGEGLVVRRAGVGSRRTSGRASRDVRRRGGAPSAWAQQANCRSGGTSHLPACSVLRDGAQARSPAGDVSRPAGSASTGRAAPRERDRDRAGGRDTARPGAEGGPPRPCETRMQTAEGSRSGLRTSTSGPRQVSVVRPRSCGATPPDAPCAGHARLATAAGGTSRRRCRPCSRSPRSLRSRRCSCAELR